MKIQIRYNPEIISEGVNKMLLQYNPEKHPQSSDCVRVVTVDRYEASKIAAIINNDGSWIDLLGISSQFFGKNTEEYIEQEIVRCIPKAIKWWREAAMDKDFIVANHNGYHFPNETHERRTFMGFGGAEMRCMSLRTGETKTSNDVWHRGEIPMFLWDEYPDTHVFI